MRMCPDSYFWNHSMNDYEYNNLKKSEAVLAWKKRILKDLMRSKNTSGYFLFYVDNISIKTYFT